MSENKTKRCENCGAMCDIEDTYCKRCSRSFKEPYVEEEQVIEGISNRDVTMFIETNDAYYMDKFRKSKGKKWFVSWNWPAFLFQYSWFFYRKMYKAGILYVAITFALSTLLTTTVPLLYRNTIEESKKTIAIADQLEAATTYNPDTSSFYDPESGLLFTYDYTTQEFWYYDESVNDFRLYDDPSYEPPITDYDNSDSVYQYPLLIEAQEASQRLTNQLLQMYLIIVLITAVVTITMRLFANAVYKQHIKKHISNPDLEGTSWTAAIVGTIGVELVVSLLSYLISLTFTVSGLDPFSETLFNTLLL